MTETATIVRPAEAWQQFAELHLWIRDRHGQHRPFFANSFQLEYDRQFQEIKRTKRRAHVLVLKSRQGGITTLEQVKNYHLVATRDYQQVVTLAHEADSTEKIFRIAKLFHEQHAGGNLGTKREIRFPENHSSFYIGTAGARAFGRGQTLSRVHASEVAYWPGTADAVENLTTGLQEACAYGELVFETTAAGSGGWFAQAWIDSKNGANGLGRIFLPWWFDDTLRLPVGKEQEEELRDTLSDEEKMLLARHHLSFEQLSWRRWQWKQSPKKARQEFPEDDVSAFLAAGTSFFDIDVLHAVSLRCQDPIERRHIPGGEILIWRKPEGGKEYDAGADSAEGVPGRDFSAAGFLERESGEQVAAIHGVLRPERFAHHLVELGREYHTARLAIERNNHGHSTINTVVNTLKYPTARLYHDREFDVRSAKPSERVGGLVTKQMRARLLDDLAIALETGTIQVHDRAFVEECRYFKSNSAGHYEAEPGKHDDRVFAWGWALQMRQSRRAVPLVSV